MGFYEKITADPQNDLFFIGAGIDTALSAINMVIDAMEDCNTVKTVLTANIEDWINTLVLARDRVHEESKNISNLSDVLPDLIESAANEYNSPTEKKHEEIKKTANVVSRTESRTEIKTTVNAERGV